MGYFSNGCEGGDYEERYCNQCVHQYGLDGQTPCAVWTAHLMCNYDECNKPESILHMLIPRSPCGMMNGECKMFLPASSPATSKSIRRRKRNKIWKPKTNSPLPLVG